MTVAVFVGHNAEHPSVGQVGSTVTVNVSGQYGFEVGRVTVVVTGQGDGHDVVGAGMKGQ